MSEFKNVRVGNWKSLKSLSELRSFLVAKVPSVEIDGKVPDFETVELGYIEPGHGMKGRKQWLVSNNDIEEMYKKHSGKHSILLWSYSCILPSTKNKQAKKPILRNIRKAWLKLMRNIMNCVKSMVINTHWNN